MARYSRGRSSVVNQVKRSPGIFIGVMLLGSALTVWGMMPKSVVTQLNGLNPKKKSAGVE